MRVAGLLLAAAVAAAEERQVIPMRTDLPRGEEVFIGPNDTERRIRKITSPTMIVYPAAKSNGTGIVIVPGGGLNYVTIDKEGTAAAEWLNTLGVTAFVLKHRVTFSTFDDGLKIAGEDATLAVRLAKRRAAEWGLDPARIGMMGFSSGGYLTLAAATSARAESRPAFAAAIYASAPDDVQVPSGAPPLFLVLAHDDNEGMRDATLRVYTAWHKARVPAELHIFWKGGHGFGMRKRGDPTDAWPERMADWLRSRRLIP